MVRKMNKMLFIKTQDESTANKLMGLGYPLLSNNSGTWTFENTAKENGNIKTFMEENKVVMDNKMFI